MEVYSTVHSLQGALSIAKKQNLKIGFVPTMGALHNGHLSLVREAKKKADVVVVSIFVNPTQFNNPSDLEKYPRTLESDLALLESENVDFVFTPTSQEIYPENYQRISIELGILDQVMEGKHRPGHFQGVVEVVKRLFEIVTPDIACFGIKDFQQVAVIKYMVNYFKLPVQIIECPIIRSEKGLAMSSRNARLSDQQKDQSLVIYETLLFAKDQLKNYNPTELVKLCTEKINATGMEVEYIEFVDEATLVELTDTWKPNTVCCIVAYNGEIRLIDNMKMN